MMSIPSASIHHMHVNKEFYTIGADGQVQNTNPNQCGNPLKTAHKLFELANGKEGKEKQVLESCAFDYLRWMEQKALVADRDLEEFQTLKARGLIQLFRVNATEAIVENLKKEIQNNTPWYQFIQKNRIHYSTHGQELDFNPDLIGQVCVNGKWSNWSDFTIIETGEGYTFSKNGKLCFITDKSYRLKNYSYIGNLGIVEGSLQQVNALEGFFKRPPTGKYWLSVYASITDPLKVQLGSSHSYLALEDAEGNFFYAGQFGSGRGFHFSDVPSLFAEKKMAIETPDRYSTLPLARHHLKEARIEITPEQYEKLVGSIKQDKENGVEGTYIFKNCAHWVGQKLKLIGIQAKTTMTFQSFLLRLCLQIVPKSISHRIINCSHNLPEWVKKAAQFNPVFYPAAIAASAIVSLLSGPSKSDFSVINAIFRPWEVKVNQPIALYDWLDELQKEQNSFSILNAKPISQSELGQAVQSAYQAMGFNEEDVGKLKARTSDHIAPRQPLPLPLLAIKSFFDAILRKFKNLWERKSAVYTNTKLLYLHHMMDQQLISPYQFYCLRESIDDKEDFQRQLIDIVQLLNKNHLIDRRSFIHLNQQLRQGIIDGPLQYIVSLSLLKSFNNENRLAAIKDLITPEVQMEINTHIRHYRENFHFSSQGVKAIQAFVSRAYCYEWANKINDSECKSVIVKAIQTKDEVSFARGVRFFLNKNLSNENLTIAQKKMLKEMMQSMLFSNGESAFVHFGMIMQTQARVHEVQKQLNSLHRQIASLNQQITTDEIEDLKNLHQNLGVYITNHIGYSGSSALMSPMIEMLRSTWESINDLLSKRIIPSRAETDFWANIEIPAAASKMQLNAAYPLMDLDRSDQNHFEQNLVNLFSLEDAINPEGVAPTLKSALLEADKEGKYIKLNEDLSKFEPSSKLITKDIEYAVDVMIREINSSRETSSADLERLIRLANKAKTKAPEFVGSLNNRLQSIDFHRVSKFLRKGTDFPKKVKDLESTFLIPEAYRELMSWAELNTSRSRRNPERYGEEKMINEQDLLKVYYRYPEELEFVKSLHLHRKASAFDHPFSLNAENHLCILYNGSPAPVSQLIREFHFVNDRIVSKSDGTEYTYTYDRGLSQVMEEQHPAALPVFKVNPHRKSNDFRIEIMSASGKNPHGWIRLKDPSGNVFSLGVSRDPDYRSFDTNQLFGTLPGHIRVAGDVQEFLGEEDHWKRTKIVLNEKKFRELKDRVIQIQKEGVDFNLINSNCASFVNTLLNDLSLRYQLADSPLVIYAMPKSIRKFLMKHQMARTIIEVAAYPLRLLQNAALSCFGMWSKCDVGPNSEGGFSNILHLFTWHKGALDHPKQLTLLQEILEETYEADANGKIHFSQFIKTEKTRLAGDRALVPSHAH